MRLNGKLLSILSIGLLSISGVALAGETDISNSSTADMTVKVHNTSYDLPAKNISNPFKLTSGTALADCGFTWPCPIVLLDANKALIGSATLMLSDLTHPTTATATLTFSDIASPHTATFNGAQAAGQKFSFLLSSPTINQLVVS